MIWLLDTNAVAADYYAGIKRDQERKGLQLAENDLWIAAAAQSIGATVVTRDQDFTRIDDLTVEDWSQ